MMIDIHPRAGMLRCWTEIQLDLLTLNLRELRSQLPCKCGVISVLKADAYGHGLVEVALALRSESTAFAVACLPEAIKLQTGIPDRDIIILGSTLPEERQRVVECGFIATVSSVEEVVGYAKYARVRPARICIKIDTGMGRIGIWKEEAGRCLQALARIPGISVHSIATHLPVWEEDLVFSWQQLQWMRNYSAFFRKLFPGAYLHVLSSTGILEFPSSAFDLVRPGLALYGIAIPRQHQHRLKPVLAWKTRVVSVRQVEKGRSVGYGRTYITSKVSRLATLAVGYADGYPYSLSGSSASVLIRGRHCPVVGRVTMDSTVVDVSELPDIHYGEEVVLIGRDREEEILASDMAGWASTIAWEILTRIHPGRMTRLFLGSSTIQ
ncbi:Alanine racemase [Candidatus Xiphinematobacter sp. Idaho Grape]|uniref:alanine racemase n=1 Tax=Candidatus Xiphinematobacter sp. Idaho Grape TaxID=1704307 RepID=UPI000706CDF6|nr:alanine racemase [Candidatus Xiphinematobacter sp. Idaho Grape]ALJ56408.1 Alanine racemase [Candidatus Xiphinematobacter sp. Idaho Grape]